MINGHKNVSIRIQLTQLIDVILVSEAISPRFRERKLVRESLKKKKSSSVWPELSRRL